MEHALDIPELVGISPAYILRRTPRALLYVNTLEESSNSRDKRRRFLDPVKVSQLKTPTMTIENSSVRKKTPASSASLPSGFFSFFLCFFFFFFLTILLY